MLDDDGSGPIPLANSHITEENCEYKHIEVELTCPGKLPPEMNGRGAAFRVIDLEGAPLLPSAVRLGTFLYLYQIKAILSSLTGVPPMEKGSEWEERWLCEAGLRSSTCQVPFRRL